MLPTNKQGPHGNVPRFVLTQPWVNTPTGAWLSTFQKYSTVNFGALNRLDRDTSGIVFLAKDKEICARVEKLRDKRKLHKEYVALVHGVIPV